MAEALENPRRDTNRIVLPPASYMHEKEKIEQRWPAAINFIKERKLNEFFDGDIDEVGIIMQGGMYNGVIRALQGLGLADVWGNTRIPLYVMNVTYPLIDDEIVEFCTIKARGADGRGRPARLHRAGPAQGAAHGATFRPRSTARASCRWAANIPRP